MSFKQGTTTGYATGGKYFYSFDYSSSLGTIPVTTEATLPSGIDSFVMKADCTRAVAGAMKYARLVTIGASSSPISGDGTFGCTEGAAASSQHGQLMAMQWENEGETAVAAADNYCNYITTLLVASPNTYTWKVGGGRADQVTELDGFGLSARIIRPKAVAKFKGNYYVGSGAYSRRISIIRPNNNWQYMTISDGSTEVTTSGNGIPFDGSFQTLGILYTSSLMQWSNCYLQIWHQVSADGHIVDMAQGMAYKLTGMSGAAWGVIDDPAGNAWVFGENGVASRLAKYTIAYPGCQMPSLNCIATSTKEITPTVVPTPAPTLPATTAVATESSSASSVSSATTVSLATSAATATATTESNSATSVTSATSGATATATMATTTANAVATNSATTTTATTTTATSSADFLRFILVSCFRSAAIAFS